MRLYETKDKELVIDSFVDKGKLFFRLEISSFLPESMTLLTARKDLTAPEIVKLIAALESRL